MNPGTVLEIGNEALAMLGAQPVMQADEGTELASTLFRIGPSSLAAVLTAHPWACTMRQARLPRRLAPPELGFRYAYALPAEMLAFRGAYAGSHPGAPPIAVWRIQGEELLCDAEEVWAEFQAEPPLARWPPHLRHFARAALAADLALNITGSNSDAQLMTQRAWGLGEQSLLAQARRVEAQQQPHMAMTDFPLIAARHGGAW